MVGSNFVRLCAVEERRRRRKEKERELITH
jgi:hypothetical protein